MPGTIDSCECWLDIACSTAAADETCGSSCPVLIPLFRFGQKVLIDSPSGESAFQRKRQAPRSKVFRLQRVQLSRALLGFVMASDITFLPIAV
jgi:hypothetical protein